MPKVTCIMAAWNARATIAEAIDSVMTQTHADLELIVVDDGSTDSTAEIVKTYQDPRVRLIRQANTGPSAARNRAIAKATGKYLACIDADDVWLPTKLATQVPTLERDPEAALSYGWTDFVDAQLRPLYPDGRATFAGEVYSQLLRENFISCGSNSLLRHSAVREVGCFDSQLAAVEDWDLHLRLANRYRVACTPEVLVLYRQAKGTLSGRVEVMERCFRKVSAAAFLQQNETTPAMRAMSEAAFYRYLIYRVRATQPWPRKAFLLALYTSRLISLSARITTHRLLNGDAPLSPR